MALMGVTTVLTGLNILLVLALIYVYIGNFRKIKSGFTIGLLMFAVLFLIETGVSFYYFITMMPLFALGLEVHVFVITVLHTLAFTILNVLTWK